MKANRSCLTFAAVSRFARASRQLTILLICLSSPAFGQIINQARPPESSYAVTERGQHYRIMSTVTWGTNGAGRTFARTNSYTELATGMHHLVDGQWRESTDEIIIVPGGAAATNASHQVAFSANAETAEAIRLTMPDGKILSSHVIGISYLDTATGSNAMVAELHGSSGQLLSSGELLYTNALQGDFVGDILCKFSNAGMEQSVIIRTKPTASPDEYGLDPATTMLQLWTEFINPPAPIIQSVPQRKVTTGAGTVLTDIELNFGVMKIGAGKAFSIGDRADPDSVRVIKEWVTIQNRTFLVEQVPLAAVAASLRTLPPAGTTGTNAPRHASLRRTIPPLFAPRSLQVGTAHPAIQLARANFGLGRGFLMDYSIVTSQTNLVLQSDTTYYITGPVNLSGSTVIEGGTVVKFTNSSAASLNISGPIVCKTGPYRMAVFTSKDDSTVGQAISGANGNPTNFPGQTFLSGGSGNTRYQYLRLAYAGTGIFGNVDGAGAGGVWDCQFLQCSTGVVSKDTTICLRNVLFSKCATAVEVNYSGDPLNAENVTADQVGVLFSAFYPNGGGLTNCILTAVTNIGPVAASYNCVTNSSSTGFYQTVGAASYYLADGSPYRNSGTTNINPTLLSQLRQKTTYPPNVFYFPAVYFSNDLTLSALVPRDNGSSVALGYHYDPIDWAISYLSVTNATITINPGTVITPFASIGDSGFSYPGGIAISMGAQLSAEGTPTSPVRFVENSTVQEHSNTNWTSKPYAFILPSVLGGTPASIINCRFVDFSSLAQDCKHFSYGYGNALPVNAQDCQFHGGIINLAYHPINLTNCLLERVACYLYWDDEALFSMRNNLFFGGDFELTPGATNAIIKDNLFDRTTISADLTDWGYDGGYNAYVTNCDTILPTYVSDILLTNTGYLPGPLGPYYYPTNGGNLSRLTNSGSITANLIGLYHFTTQVDQRKELNSVVDRGFHYVAVNANGNPLDSDGDGIADWLEDINGNGTVESGETDWQSATDLGLRVIITRPKNNSIIP